MESAYGPTSCPQALTAPTSAASSSRLGTGCVSRWRENAQMVCEICGSPSTRNGRTVRPDCHEKWVFEFRAGTPVQRLERLIALCPACHQVQHSGLARVQGLGRGHRASSKSQRLVSPVGRTGPYPSLRTLPRPRPLRVGSLLFSSGWAVGLGRL